MKALKSLAPYLLIAALMGVAGACNANAKELLFSNIELRRLGMFLAPLLVTLTGFVVGRAMRLSGPWPRWRVILDGVLILVLFLAGNSAMTMTLFGWSDVLWRLTALAGQAGLENVCALFAGILLGRLTLLIGRRRGGEAAPEQKEGAAKALKSLVPYLLVAVLMWLLWLSNSNADRLIFMVDGAYLAVFLLTPLLPLLMGVIAGRSARLPAVYPWWRAALDGALALLLFLMGHSGLTIHLFGPFGKLGAIAASAAKGGLRVPLVVFAGLLLGRLTLLIGRRRAKETVSE